MNGKVAHAPRDTARRKWRMPWLTATACLVILAGVCVFLYPQVASWFSQREQSRVIEFAQQEMLQPPNDDALFRQQLLALAREYNEDLASGALYEADANIAVGEGRTGDDSLAYGDLLNIQGSGFMGRLQYSALSIDLPIYHGTSDETLEQGIGHLEGTSLPVGGIGTRSVLTAHRGLPSATLFNDLDDAQMGDTFTVSVLDEVLTYQVIKIQTIEPDQTEAILPDQDRDLVTLVTCTPLGINSHRILVTAERVLPTPPEDLAGATETPDIPGFPWWAVILGTLVIAGVTYVWRAGYGPVPAAKKPQSETGENEKIESLVESSSS